MTATDELRHLLDGRGIEHMDFNMPERSLTLFAGDEHDGAYTENSVDTILTVYGASPAQAVEATLGSDLEAENAKLREELAKWERLTAGINLPDYPISQFVPKDLERENAKLRELVRDVMPIVCDGCHERLCKMPKEEHPFITCWFADRMFELGIEVD